MKKKKNYVSPEFSEVDSLDVTILAGSGPKATTEEVEEEDLDWGSSPSKSNNPTFEIDE